MHRSASTVCRHRAKILPTTVVCVILDASSDCFLQVFTPLSAPIAIVSPCSDPTRNCPIHSSVSLITISYSFSALRKSGASQHRPTTQSTVKFSTIRTVRRNIAFLAAFKTMLLFNRHSTVRLARLMLHINGAMCGCLIIK